MRSRVMPGSSPTIERRLPVSRLKSVDLPTFGRPTMATRGMVAGDGALCGLTLVRGWARDLRELGKEPPGCFRFRCTRLQRFHSCHTSKPLLQSGIFLKKNTTLRGGGKGTWTVEPL